MARGHVSPGRRVRTRAQPADRRGHTRHLITAGTVTRRNTRGNPAGAGGGEGLSVRSVPVRLGQVYGWVSGQWPGIDAGLFVVDCGARRP